MMGHDAYNLVSSSFPRKYKIHLYTHARAHKCVMSRMLIGESR